MTTDAFILDDRQLLLRRRVNANLQHGYHHAHGIYAQKVLRGRGPEQLRAKHLLLRGIPRHGPDHQWYWQRLALHHSWLGCSS